MRDLIDYPAYILTGEVSNYERITFTNEHGVLKFFYGGRPVKNIREIVVTTSDLTRYFRTHKQTFSLQASVHGQNYVVEQNDYTIIQPVIAGVMTVEVRLSVLLTILDKQKVKKGMVGTYIDFIDFE